MRIAFITPEFVTEYNDGGGLGNYLNRMGKLLSKHGHQVEVFVSSYLEPRVIIHDGIRVERVNPVSRKLSVRLLRRICARTGLSVPLRIHEQADALATVMEKRHHEAPFDVVQSADYFAVGLKVRKAKNRIHLVRCSCAVDLYNEIDGRKNSEAQWQEKLELASIKQADKAYAPSRFVAEHYQKAYGIHVEVVRPPVAMEIAPAIDEPCGLPERFFVHFGQFRKRKGTYWLAESLQRAFDEEPSLRMVWVGPAHDHEFSAALKGLERYRSKLQVLYPMPKPELYAVLQRAEAAVLPSLVDNLPNTVIESLMLGIPVIGTRGASIDELVEPGVTGELVPLGDVAALASAIVRVWRGQSSLIKGFHWHGGLAEELQPNRAVNNFLKLAEH